MTKSKKTKRALIASMLTLMLCISMFIGSTFAWFTDSASTGVNQIESGTLDVVILDKNDNSLEGETLEFIKAEGSENNLWEPGSTWTLPEIYVKNNGNLALKYQIEITGFDGDAKLNEAIEWSGLPTADNEGKLEAGEKSEAITISAHMKEDAGNEYQGLKMNGISITVHATQDTVEFDSTTNEYDENATYLREVTDTSSIQEAINFAAKTGEPVTIKMSEDIELKKILTIPADANVTLDMNGQKMTAVDGTVDPLIDMKAGSSLVITGNGTFDLEDNVWSNLLIPRGDVTIENGRFLKNRGDNADAFGPLFTGINGGKGVLTINGGYFDGGYYKDGDCFENCRKNLNLSWGQVVRVYGGTFVAQNPAWGDEGMAYLCDQCQHTSGYCQGTFLVGQGWQDTKMPAGYTITEGKTNDGRPTYTVSYTGTR